jgi:hypothetical protein
VFRRRHPRVFSAHSSLFAALAVASLPQGRGESGVDTLGERATLCNWLYRLCSPTAQDKLCKGPPPLIRAPAPVLVWYLPESPQQLCLLSLKTPCHSGFQIESRRLTLRRGLSAK